MWQGHSNPHGANPLNRLTYSKQAENLSVGKTKSYSPINSEDISLNNESLVALRKDESDSSFQDERCFYRLCPKEGC